MGLFGTCGNIINNSLAMTSCDRGPVHTASKNHSDLHTVWEENWLPFRRQVWQRKSQKPLSPDDELSFGRIQMTAKIMNNVV